MGGALTYQIGSDPASDVAPTAETQSPTLGDEKIRDAILAERSRALVGNSRKASFAVRGQSTSYLGE